VEKRYANFRLLKVMKRQLLVALSGGWTVVVSIPMISHACSVCLTGAGDPTADAFNTSVLFLMVMPYVVVGSIVGGLIFMYRRAVKRRDQTDGAQPVVHLTWNEEESGR
jgi:hypothetical protein